jgi:hypothetical protein
MRGTFVFAVGGVRAYGTVVVTGGGVRLGAPSAVWESLAVAEGQTVRLDVPDVFEGDLLVSSVTRPGTGTTWADLSPPLRQPS